MAGFKCENFFSLTDTQRVLHGIQFSKVRFLIDLGTQTCVLKTAQIRIVFLPKTYKIFWPHSQAMWEYGNEAKEVPN